MESANHLESTVRPARQFSDPASTVQAMGSTEENRFDPDIIRKLLLDIAHEQSLDKLLLKILDTAIARTAVTCAQFWLVEKGDLCAKCPHRAECPDQTRCLHLVAGRTVSVLRNDQKQTWIDDPNARIPLGTGAAGEALAKRDQVFLKDSAQLVRISGFDSLQQEQRAECGIGEVPLDMQSKLLRVLHEKLSERVGDDRTRSADVRIIVATNRELKKAVAAGRFREDLYYRLNVFPIQVLPLRERMDDVPLLAEHFVELSTRELKCDKPRLTRAGVAKLQSYNWPGNVRELRNVIERAVILARGEALDFDLPVTSPPAPGSRTNRPADSPAASLAQAQFLTETEIQLRERENLATVLETANWKIKGPNGAAELLGIKPSTLISRMHKWGLKKPEPLDT